MRKMIFFLFFLFLFGCFNVDSKNYEYLVNDDLYDFYYVSIDNLSTKNFNNYFDGVNVISIYPFVNPIYKSRIGNVSYRFLSHDNSYEISNFSSSFLSLIKKNSYSDYNYLYIFGINIDKVLVYMKGSDLYNFINSTGALVFK